MAELERPDGAKIHYEIRGEDGPAIVLAPYWGWVPGTYDEIFERLGGEHRIVTYHLRGTGQSSRQGPYDMETETADLEAVVAAAGGPAVLLALADSGNRAAHLGARRPDLIESVVCVGAPPLPRTAFDGSDAMLSSEETIAAFIGMIESNYRAAIRGLVQATNSQMSEDDLRQRVDLQVDFAPAEVTVERSRAWFADDPDPDARELGERLWVLLSSETAGQWFPSGEEVGRMTNRLFPQARVEWLEPGPISNPELAAEILRQVTAPLRETAARG